VPRPPRLEVAGGIHHVYSRGAKKSTIFVHDDDRQLYLLSLAKVIRFMSWNCLSYCLMGNHMHLLIETPQPNLGRGMQRLHGPYAREFNRRHAGSGHVYGARFDSKLVTSDMQFWATANYIAQNPVEAGLCRTPETWPWSSHAQIAAGQSPPWLASSRLFSFFESFGGDPRERYLDYVAASTTLP
jgi:REP element-mobilizing transposase RayT